MVAETAQSAELRAQRIIRSKYADIEIPEVSITEYVLGRAAARGDKPAIVEGATGRTLTYAHLVDLVRRAAAVPTSPNTRLRSTPRPPLAASLRR